MIRQVDSCESGKFMKEAFDEKVIEINKRIRAYDMQYFQNKTFEDEIKILTNRY